MNVYEVISYNLDIKDGTFCHVLFSDNTKAFDYCKEEVATKQATGITEDWDGGLVNYQGHALTYEDCRRNPAIYYRSHYGNYRMVIYIKTRQVH